MLAAIFLEVGAKSPAEKRIHLEPAAQKTVLFDWFNY